MFGDTGLEISRIALGGFPFGGVNRARNWDPWSPEGRKTAITTIHRALDLGINYVDTAPSYGDGNSESIIGKVMRTRREECVLATKVGWQGLDKAAVIGSVRASLGRLQTDHVDVVQIHGGMYTQRDYEHIMNNLIYQSAAQHALEEAREQGMGVVTMRTMTSGIFQRTVRFLAPEWQEARDVYEVCLKFVLSDSRVHAPIVGMRWPEEVEKNVRLAGSSSRSWTSQRCRG